MKIPTIHSRTVAAVNHLEVMTRVPNLQQNLFDGRRSWFLNLAGLEHRVLALFSSNMTLIGRPIATFAIAESKIAVVTKRKLNLTFLPVKKN